MQTFLIITCIFLTLSFRLTVQLVISQTQILRCYLSRTITFCQSYDHYSLDDYSFSVYYWALYLLSYMPYTTCIMEPSWLWSYCSWIYNYLCNQCLSSLKLWVRIPLMERCTRYNIIWFKFVSDLWQVSGFLWVLRFPPPIKLTTQYNWNIVESCVKPYNLNLSIKLKSASYESSFFWNNLH